MRKGGAFWDRRDSEKDPKGVFYIQYQYEYTGPPKIEWYQRGKKLRPRLVELPY
jgi:hypothetical protein